MATTGGFLDLRDAIAAALADGATLDDVESLLDGAPLDREDRDALWLYAWGMAEGRRRFNPRPEIQRRLVLF